MIKRICEYLTMLILAIGFLFVMPETTLFAEEGEEVQEAVAETQEEAPAAVEAAPANNDAAMVSFFMDQAALTSDAYHEAVAEDAAYTEPAPAEMPAAPVYETTEPAVADNAVYAAPAADTTTVTVPETAAEMSVRSAPVTYSTASTETALTSVSNAANNEDHPYDPQSKELWEQSILTDAEMAAAAAAAAVTGNFDIAFAETSAAYQQTKALIDLYKAEKGLEEINKALSRLQVEVDGKVSHFSTYVSSAKQLDYDIRSLLYDADLIGIDIEEAADDAEDSTSYEEAQGYADDAAQYLDDLLSRKKGYEETIQAALEQLKQYKADVAEVAEQYTAAFENSEAVLETEIKPYLDAGAEALQSAAASAATSAVLANERYGVKAEEEKEAMLQEGSLLDNLASILPIRIQKDIAYGVKTLADYAAANVQQVSAWYSTYRDTFRLDKSILNTVLGYEDQIERIIRAVSEDYVDPYSGITIKSYQTQLAEIFNDAIANAKRAQDAADRWKNASASILNAVNPNAMLTAVASDPEGEPEGNTVLTAVSVGDDSEPVSGETENVTAEDAEHAISHAEIEEGFAGAGSVFADSETRNEIITNEASAIIKDELAKDSLEEAEENLQNAQTDGETAKEAVEEADKAVEDLSSKTSDAVIADSNADVANAEQAYDEIRDAETPEAYKAAADKAKQAYDNALALSNAADEAYSEASARYQAAYAAYEAAKAEYEAAIDAAEQGVSYLESAEQDAYEAYLAAEAYLEKIAEETGDAKEKADAAKEQLEKDWETLKSAAQKLGNALITSTAAFGKDFGKTVATGIGYSVADLIADYYDVHIEQDKEPIIALQDTIANEEKHLALELQSRLNEENSQLSDDERKNMQDTLVELVIRNLHRDADKNVILKQFDNITAIDGFKISDYVPVIAEEGDSYYFIKASDDIGNEFYYEVIYTADGDIRLYPFRYEKEKQTRDTMILPGETFIQYSSYEPVADENFRYVYVNDYVAQKAGIFGPTNYDLVAIEYYPEDAESNSENQTVYQAQGLPVYKYVLWKHGNESDKTRVLSSIRDAIAAKEYDKIDSKSITELLENYKVYQFAFTIAETPVSVQTTVADYPLERRPGDEEYTTSSELIAHYQSVIDVVNTQVAELEAEVYGEDLNRCIQKILPQFVKDNLENFAKLLFPDSAKAAEENPGIWEKLTASFSNLDISGADFSNGFFDGVTGLFKTVSSSILSGLMPAASDESSSIQWDTSSLDPFQLLQVLNSVMEKHPELLESVEALIGLISGTFDEKTIQAILDIVNTLGIAPNTKRTVADSARTIMQYLHHVSYEHLKATSSAGISSIFNGLLDTGGSLISVVSDLGSFISTGAQYGIDWIRILYAEDLVADAIDAYDAASNATETMKQYRDELKLEYQELLSLGAVLHADRILLEASEQKKQILNGNLQEVIDTYDNVLAWQLYQNTSGAGQTWKKESAEGPLFVFRNLKESGSEITFDHFTGIQVDGVPVSEEHYIAEKGSVRITLKPSYLNQLRTGQHTLSALFDNGRTVTSRFSIAEADPKPTPAPEKKSSGETKSSSSSSVVTCQMAGYPNGYAWNDAAKACQPGYIDANGVFHSYQTNRRYNTPNTADEGSNPFYLFFLSLISAGTLGYVFCREH